MTQLSASRWLRRVSLPAVILVVLAVSATLHAEDLKHLKLSSGVDMAYVDRGGGAPALVFIHCGNCQMGIWKETLDAFGRTHRVVAMDLAGHGKSSSNRESWSLEGLGADVAELVKTLNLGKVVLIGNSLGGPTALEAAKILGPAQVMGVVAVDTLQNVEMVWPEESFNQMLAAYQADFTKSCDAHMLQIVAPTASAEVKDRIARETCDNDPKAFLALFPTLRTYDQAKALAASGVPVRAINGSQFPTATDVNRKHSPGFTAVILDGVGHYPQVERPAEFQAELRKVVGELAAKP